MSGTCVRVHALLLQSGGVRLTADEVRLQSCAVMLATLQPTGGAASKQPGLLAGMLLLASPCVAQREL